jgi:hypothetical protein
MSTPSEIMRTAMIQGAPLSANVAIFREAVGSSDVATVGWTPRRSLHDLGDATCVLLIHRDDQAGGRGIAFPQMHELGMSLHKDARQPVTGCIESRAQSLVGQIARQGIIEGSRTIEAARCGPFHVAMDARKVNGANDQSILQRVAVAVLVIGTCEIAVVMHEGNGALVRAKGRARQTQSAVGVLEREAHAVAPRTTLASVMDLVQHGVGGAHEVAQRTRRCGDLLISHDDAVNIRRQGSVPGAPLRIEVQ